MTEWELTQAANRLRAMGLCFIRRTDKKLLPPEELPEYSASDISRRTSEDSGFKAVLAETQRTMGRILTGRSSRPCSEYTIISACPRRSSSC
jgi:hypothetical protein